MGRVAGSYGVRGWVKVAPEDGAEESLAGAKEWWIGAEAYAVERREGFTAPRWWASSRGWKTASRRWS